MHPFQLYLPYLLLAVRGMRYVSRYFQVRLQLGTAVYFNKKKLVTGLFRLAVI
jgi:hypothetical protein